MRNRKNQNKRLRRLRGEQRAATFVETAALICCVSLIAAVALPVVSHRINSNVCDTLEVLGAKDAVYEKSLEDGAWWCTGPSETDFGGIEYFFGGSDFT